jgi:capsule polysaccharide export protein KpsE/RkpR
MHIETPPNRREPLEEKPPKLWSESEKIPDWLYNLRVLWEERSRLLRITCVAFMASLCISLFFPKTYISQARIMPPESANSSSTFFAALAGRTLGSDALGGLAASLMGGRNSGALFTDFLRSTSVSDALIERFQLQDVYRRRYRIDAAKVLAKRTEVTLDKKSGVLTISVKDRDPKRARDMVQAYLDQLSLLVNRTSTSSAHQERVFIERRLEQVKGDLARAQEAMSEFSSNYSAVDLQAQAKATVESAAKVQGELIVAEGELESLEQIYGEKNVRVREEEVRIAALRRELSKMGGSSAPLTDAGVRDPANDSATLSSSYLPLRQVPRLAVPYANLYREVRLQETVFDLLTQQYEFARIQEAKDIPAVGVIDAPAIPEKKSFPPRALMTLGLTLAVVFFSCVGILVRHYWLLRDPGDPRRVFGREIVDAIAKLPLLKWARSAP